MREPAKLNEIIFEVMTLLKERRTIEQRMSKGNGTPADHAKLRAINARLQE